MAKSCTNFSFPSVDAYTSATARSSEFDPKIKSTGVAVHFAAPVFPAPGDHTAVPDVGESLRDGEVLALLADIQKKHNLGYVFISHDLQVIGAMAHRVAVMRNGFVVESGEVEKIFANPSDEYTRKLLTAALNS